MKFSFNSFIPFISFISKCRKINFYLCGEKSKLYGFKTHKSGDRTETWS